MEAAKLQFSEHEMKLVCNADWILTKNEILNKVSLLMGELNRNQKNIIDTLPANLPVEILATTPKISRGENYKGLPYLVLDYPRLFTRGNIFAIRSLFWWGNYISTTVHLSGKWQHFFGTNIINSYENLANNDFLIATSDDEWVHDIGGNDYSLAKNFTKESLKEMVISKSYFKIGLFSPIGDLNNAINIWERQFQNLVKLL